jgi:hypothetical protein
MNKQTIRAYVIGAALCGIGHAIVAHAENVALPAGTILQVGTTNPTSLVGGTVILNPDGSFGLAGQQQGGSFNGGSVWDLAWDLTLNQDPSIAGTLALRNLTTTTRSFNLFFQLPVTPAFSPSLFGGSITATAYDDSGDSVLALAPSSAAPSIYRGQIDGSTVLWLFAAGLQCLPSAPHCSAGGSESDGLPGPTNPGPGVSNNIGLLLSFTLTPGDRAVFDVDFTVEPVSSAPVPLPAGLPLLVAGLTALGTLRRRNGDSPRSLAKGVSHS